MPNTPLFPNAYPRGGQVAILCEGDAVGYEAKLLKQWADAVRPGGKMVDVWPCGTGHGVRGMADAIGRTVPIHVILDRDFHDSNSAEALAKDWKRDAEKLGWSWLGVRFWRRNEIENYFLDDDVVQPVMTAAFGCAPELVTRAVDIAVKLLVPFQSLHASLHTMRVAWGKSDPASSLLGPCRPHWRGTELEAVKPAEVKADIAGRLAKWHALMVRGDEGKNQLLEPWSGSSFVAEFDRRVTEWADLTSASRGWREVWAGKEVLKLVRQQLCAQRPGWWSLDAQKQQPVQWHAMKNNAERDAHDRKIERELLPKFVNHLVGVIRSSDPSDPRRAEFDELAVSLGA